MLDATKKIIIVGVGLKKRSLFHYILSQLNEKNYNVVGIADNDKTKQGIYDGDYCIEAVEDCIRKNGNVFIIISTIKEYDSLTNQMQDLKLVRGEDYEYAFCMEEIFNANSYAFYKNAIVKNGLYYPSSVRLEMSSRCNLQCIYCRYHSVYMRQLPKGCNSDLDFATFKEIIKQINDIGTVTEILNVQKGEMLCNPKWFEMLHYILEYSSIRRFHFSTNGMFLSKDVVQKLIALNFDELSVTISLDGYDSAENDRLRKNAKFAVIEENVKYLLEKRSKNMKIQFQNTQLLNEDDVNRVKDNVELAVDENNYLKKVFGNDVDVQRYSALITGHEEIDKRIEQEEKVYVEYIHKIASTGCPLPLLELTIDSEGYVCVCGCEPWGQLLRIGNIKDGLLLDIWNNKKMQEIRGYYKVGNEVPICKHCVLNALSNNKTVGVFVKSNNMHK